MANYIPITTVTVGSGGAASISFSSIPAIYTDLIVKASARTDTANNVQNLYVEFNGSGGTAYSSRTIYALNTGTPASTLASADSKIQYAGYASGANSTANTFANFEFYIPDYTSTNYKNTLADVVTENNSVNTILLLSAGLWSSTSAINAVKITPAAGNFVQHSTATLYGIRKY